MEALTLIRGDCLEVLRTNDWTNQIDCVITDPPYGINYNDKKDLAHKRELRTRRNGKLGAPRPILNDGVVDSDRLLINMLSVLPTILKDGGTLCCCCGGGGGPKEKLVFAKWAQWIDERLDWQQMVVWDKGPLGMGIKYRRSYETILVASKGGCNWYDTTGNIENIIRPGKYGIRKHEPQAGEHPCAKPVELAEHFLRLHTKIGDTVLDPFMGAGWVGVAAKKMGRKFIGIEIDEHWYEIAVKRIKAQNESIVTILHKEKERRVGFGFTARSKCSSPSNEQDSTPH